MKKYIFLSAALLLFTASCSNDENNNEQKEPTQAIQFSFTNEDFGEDEAVTRANAAGAKPQIVDLGDCEAEITVESEPAVKTRGTQTPATGHYTIRAYQAGTLKGEMSGTFSGGTFTPDASSHKMLNLPYGTYDFVAFNDDVTVSGTNLTTPRAKAETARMGFATVNITSPTPIQVLFTMKHVGCRLRTQFICQKHIPENITATLEQTAANVIPASVVYNPATKAYSATNGAMTATANNSPASTETPYTASNAGATFAYTSTSNYHYFLPTTEGSKLKLTSISAGTVFWKPIPVFNVSKLNATLQMQAGKSYVVKIKLKPNYVYLMSDGTTGHFKDTTFGGGSKIPVGVVADPTAHVAIALKNVSDETEYGWWGTNPHAENTTLYSPTEAGITDMDGYKWTWEAVGTTDGSIKANQQVTYPAFYAAGHYNPGIPVSGTLVNKKWYLPGLGEFYTYGAKDLGFAVDTNFSPFYGVLVDESFTKVGGTKLTSDDTVYIISTEFKGSAPYYHPEQYKFSFSYLGWGWSGGSYASGIVRPFIKY